MCRQSHFDATQRICRCLLSTKRSGWHVIFDRETSVKASKAVQSRLVELLFLGAHCVMETPRFSSSKVRTGPKLNNQPVNTSFQMNYTKKKPKDPLNGSKASCGNVAFLQKFQNRPLLHKIPLHGKNSCYDARNNFKNSIS